MWCCKSIMNNNEIPNILKAPRRAPVPSAYEAPGPRGRRARRARVRQCVDPHGLPCAVQARCNSCLVSRGDAPVGPAGPDAPPSPLPRRLRPLGAQRRASCFFWFPNQEIPAIKIFQVTNEKHQNRSGSARSYLAPAVRCGKERPSDCRGAVQQLPAESWEVMRSVRRSITSTKHMAHLL